MTAADQKQVFEQMLRFPKRVNWRVKDFFRGVNWIDKDVCEIGCGRGDLAIYMALNGARSVTALDPTSRGSRIGHTTGIEERLKKLELTNFTFLPIKAEEHECSDASFDLIFGISVLEHLYETKRELSEFPEGRSNYVNAFREFHRRLRPGGALLFSDLSRTCLWAHIRKYLAPGFRTPFGKTVCWEIHQRHTIWEQLAREAGFSRSRLYWRVPYPLARLPWIADNPIFHYFTFSSFVFVAYKD